MRSASSSGFSRFYGKGPVLAEPDSAIRASPLALCSLAHAVLSRALLLLGIDAPSRI